MTYTYKNVVDYINQIPKFTRDSNLDHTKRLLSFLGDPQNDFKYIHVAGTNGKGSTCAYLSGAIAALGYKTGLFTSPHLVEMTERISCGQEEISREDFVDTFVKVKQVVDDRTALLESHPTYFEFLYLMAMVYFSKIKVDYAVIETGLGGRLDATNAVLHPVLTIITSISLEHTAILGDTIEKIAFEKAGIMKERVPIVYDANRDEVCLVIEERAKILECVTYPVKKSDCEITVNDRKGIDFCLKNQYHKEAGNAISLDTKALYQGMNASLALRALFVLFGEKPKKQWSKIQRAFFKTRWPGRMEEIYKDVYIDGAHNEDGIRKLTASVNEVMADKEICLVFAVAEDKDHDGMVTDLCQIKKLAAVVVTEIDNNRRTGMQQVMDLFTARFDGTVIGRADIKEALEAGKLMAGDDKVLLCVGSLYLAGSIKEILGGRCDD